MVAEREPTSGALSRTLSRAFVLHVVGRIVEALAIGWLAAALVLACVVLDSGSLRGDHAWIAAAIAGACAASASWLEHAPLPREHVRTVDRRMGWNGALVTASDVSEDAGGGALALALVRSVESRLKRADLARASLPSTPLALVALLLGAAVLLAARDFGARERGRADAFSTTQPSAVQRAAFADAARALNAASAGADGNRGGPDAEARRALARGLEAAAGAAVLGAEEKGAIAERLTGILGEKNLGAAEREPLARALAALGAAPPGALLASPSTAPREGADPDLRLGGLASRDPLGKMGGPDPRADGPTPGLSLGSELDTAEPGVGSLRWWPARHDAVVEAWLASTPRPK